MRILTVGDLHAHEGRKRELLEEANSGNYNLFLGVGDYERASYYEDLQSRLEIANISCTGNWDFNFEPPENNEYDQLYNYAKVDLEKSGYKIVLLGAIYPPQAQLIKELKEFTKGHPREKLIFVSHYPPQMVCDLAKAGNHGGMPEFKDLLMRFKPILWLCGHIEEAAGAQRYMKTLGVNVAARETGNAWAIELNEENGVTALETINLDSGEREDVDVPD